MKLFQAFSYKTLILIPAVAALAFIHSCTYYIETMEDSVGDNYLTDYHYSKMFDQVLDIGNFLYKGETIGTDGPYFKSIDTNGVTKVVSFTYGDTLRMCYDGVLRAGNGYITWQGDFFKPGTEISLVFDPFIKGNDWNLKGNIKITYLDKNEYGQKEYSMETTADIILNKATLENWTWTNNYTRVKVRGDNTLTSMDDVWAVWGDVYGRNRKGRFYDATIKDSLYFDNTCEYGIKKGRVDIQQVDASERMFVDYGNLDRCDQWYSFKRGDRNITITKNK